MKGYYPCVIPCVCMILGAVKQVGSCDNPHCPLLFLNLKEVNNSEHFVTSHVLYYLIQCVIPNEQAIIITDEVDFHHNFLDMYRIPNQDDSVLKGSVFPYTQIAYVSINEFLKSEREFFLDFNILQKTTSTTTERIYFVFATNSTLQMTSLLSKVDQELQNCRLHSGKLVWQPIIIMFWTEVRRISGDVRQNTNLSSQNLISSWFQEDTPNFRFDSELFFFFMTRKGSSTKSESNFHLSAWEVYKLKQELVIAELKKEYFWPSFNATGSYENTIKCKNTKIMTYAFIERFIRRGNFQGQIVAAAVPEKSLGFPSDWVTVSRENTSSKIILEQGFSVSVFQDLQMIMNFSVEIVLGIGSSYTLLPLLEELNSEKADISLNQASVYAERANISSFLQPSYSGIYHAFFEQPSASSIRNIVSAPFKAQLWFTLMATLLLIVGSVKSWTIVAKRIQVLTYYQDERFIREIGMWMIAATCQRSWYQFPNTSVFRLICCVGTLMAILCNLAYSATIVSFLTIKPEPVKTFRDLIQLDYKFTVHQFSLGTIKLLNEMIDEFKLPQHVITTDTQNEITHILKGKIAFLSYPDLFYQTVKEQSFSENYLCANMYRLPAQSIPYKSSLYVKKGSQYREIFEQKLMIVLERGLNYRYKKEYNGKREVSCLQAPVNVDPVRVSDVFTTFLVIFVGWIFAAWILLSERLYNRRTPEFNFML